MFNKQLSRANKLESRMEMEPTTDKISLNSTNGGFKVGAKSLLLKIRGGLKDYWVSIFLTPLVLRSSTTPIGT